jgi:hypothetical protein
MQVDDLSGAPDREEYRRPDSRVNEQEFAVAFPE